MDMNEYVIERLARDRLREARVQAAQRALSARSRRQGPGIRAWLGARLIALGERLATGAAHGRSCATPGASGG